MARTRLIATKVMPVVTPPANNCLCKNHLVLRAKQLAEFVLENVRQFATIGKGTVIQSLLYRESVK